MSHDSNVSFLSDISVGYGYRIHILLKCCRVDKQFIPVYANIAQPKNKLKESFANYYSWQVFFFLMFHCWRAGENLYGNPHVSPWIFHFSPRNAREKSLKYVMQFPAWISCDIFHSKDFQRPDWNTRVVFYFCSNSFLLALVGGCSLTWCMRLVLHAPIYLSFPATLIDDGNVLLL